MLDGRVGVAIPCAVVEPWSFTRTLLHSMSVGSKPPHAAGSGCASTRLQHLGCEALPGKAAPLAASTEPTKFAAILNASAIGRRPFEASLFIILTIARRHAQGDALRGQKVEAVTSIQREAYTPKASRATCYTSTCQPAGANGRQPCMHTASMRLACSWTCTWSPAPRRMHRHARLSEPPRPGVPLPHPSCASEYGQQHPAQAGPAPNYEPVGRGTTRRKLRQGGADPCLWQG